MSLKGSIALITGASRGLGRAIALKLAGEGVKVAVCARNGAELDELVSSIEELGGIAMRGIVDVSNPESIETFLGTIRRQWGCVDILINNAGLGWYKPFEEHSLEEIDKVIDVNLKGVIYGMRAVLPDMTARERGQIINIASDLSRRPLANMGVYVAAKHAVLGFSASMARELKSKGVKVMCLNPGIIDTHFGDSTPGTREETWALPPEHVSDVVLGMLKQPKYLLMDEVTVHPMHQDF